MGRSALPDQFEVLLGMSTFMNPSESKNWTNVTRVRMFGKVWLPASQSRLIVDIILLFSLRKG